ncbi:putative vitellogenin receptor yl isoform X2 [Lycorma delicatula]|uniref:putative vitellogenin receptor yl isoform X2 n=1 Tax=Lycorma delicatula TaxID=130591 RepID=UPI003F51A46D
MFWRRRFKILPLIWLHLYLLSLLIHNISCEEAEEEDFNITSYFQSQHCPHDYFRCKDGECIPMRLKCNGKEDCADGDDEHGCNLCLPPEFFRCANRRCVHTKLLCNGEDDCNDKSDEENCHQPESESLKSCKTGEFRCEDMSCIPFKFVCDRKKDCFDGSDEAVCPSPQACEENEFQCPNKCIPKKWLCDDESDCDDGSDEEKCSVRVPPEECTLDNRYFLCKDKSRCLNFFEVCNNVTICSDGSDEGGNCSDTGLCHGKCKDYETDCFPSPSGPICVCKQGYRRRNGLCEDVDECQEFGKCYQKCQNLPGSYNCLCDPGYALQRDRRRCKVEDDEAMLIFSSTTEVRVFLLNQNIYWPVTSEQKHVVGVAYDGNHLYWTEVQRGEEAIIRSEKKGTSMEVIVSAGLGIPEDLAIDWVTNNLYFTDSKYQRIGICVTDGSSVCTVIHARNLDKPRGIALHPAEGLMYWSDWGDHPVIGRSGMDGSEVIDFVNDSLHWPNGIAIDYSNDRLYWVDAKLASIESIKLDATDRRKVLQEEIKHPFSIAVFEDSLYWSDWDGKVIETCNKFTGKHKRSIIHENKSLIYGIHVFHPAIQNKNIVNPCRDSPCSDICLLSPKRTNPKGYKCACREDKVLKNNDNWCTYSDMKKSLIIGTSHALYQLDHNILGNQTVTAIAMKSIGELGAITYNPITGSILLSDKAKKEILSLEMDTLQLSVIINGDLGSVEGMSFDDYGNNLYFTDSDFGKVEVFSFHLRKRKTLLQRLGGDVPSDIAVIPAEGVMYVSFFNSLGSHIDRFSMSGNLESRSHVIENNLYGPYLPLHYSSFLHRVFWADSDTRRINNIDVEGLQLHLFRLLSTSPISLASIDSDLFWTSLNSNYLYWADTVDDSIGNKMINLGHGAADEVLKLTVVTAKVNDIRHPCRVNNGNCSHICLLDKKNKTCACPNGMLLKRGGLQCIEIPHCEITEFQCHLSSVSGIAKHCIPLTSQCDGIKDCLHGEDEKNCEKRTPACPRGKISCHDGSQCIDLKKKCDSVVDCPDHSDELNCFGPKCDEDNEFNCSSGECISILKRCDTQIDCEDGSDEKNCSSRTCKPGEEFRCTSGSCIPATWMCDGQIDCFDSSDELPGCDIKTCGPDQFTCSNGQCIDEILKCNEAADCEDESDEEDCENVAPTVGYGLIPKINRTRHCHDVYEFLCYTPPGSCVPKSARCNGTAECQGSEDEIGCNICKNNEFECDNGKCIPTEWTCDGKDDCDDESDEAVILCHPHTLKNKPEDLCDGFLCANKNQCISLDSVCDIKDDCDDRSDEGGRCDDGCINAGCSDKCRNTPTGPKCECPENYMLMGDSKTCTDINECLMGQICSQYCVNTLGGFQCSCKHPEYALKIDGKGCKAKGTEMQYLFAYQNQIRTLWDSHSHLGILYMNKDFNFRLSGLAVDVRRKYIYWTSEVNGALFRLNTDNHNFIQNATLTRPSKISVDWITGNIYVVEDDTRIIICNFQIKMCAPIYTIKSNMKIDALKVDPVTKTMFWTERYKLNQTFTKICKSDLSGFNVTVVIDKDLGIISDLFIDSIHNHIYWTDYVTQKIERATFIGTHRQLAFLSPHKPVDMAIFEDYAYFLVESNNPVTLHYLESHGNVWRCGIHGSVNWRCELKRIAPKNYGIPYHLEIMHEALQIKDPNYCKRANCSELCVLSATGPVCLCQDGKKVAYNEDCPFNSETRVVFFEGNTGILSEINKLNTLNNANEKSNLWWLLIAIICLAVPSVIVFLYYSRALTSCYLPQFCRKRLSFHSMHFDNTTYGLSPVINNSHAKSQFHHTKLSPGEHQYENPINIEFDVIPHSAIMRINYAH